MCGVTVLSLGVMLVFAPFFPHFSETFSPLLKSAHPFLGALCVSRGPYTGKLGCRWEEEATAGRFPSLAAFLSAWTRVHGRAHSPMQAAV